MEILICRAQNLTNSAQPEIVDTAMHCDDGPQTDKEDGQSLYQYFDKSHPLVQMWLVSSVLVDEYVWRVQHLDRSDSPSSTKRRPSL